ncbi:hypothetical protein J4G33_09115 [Actinotalea sp. BY-33]|uniref:Uncharacterized protein n=1 Tax=Actinotalea soli TaxID=2819234 RepID=A0A939RW96_9CELL|nr:hypothetical protein [Actinotalea soli]MBO1751961.1 hypothetical protein [Actinotalea soli]
MTTAVLLDHVAAYASAVRSHLRDLSPEQVEDLTDGLEADLAEALEDPAGAVTTGELALGAVGAGMRLGGPDDPAAMIDLTRRFGPAGEYAAELRAAAGLGPARAAATEPGLMRRLARRITAERLTWEAALQSSAAWRTAGPFVVSLRPLWWVLRGWVWFVVTVGAFHVVVGFHSAQAFVPANPGAWLLLATSVVLSVQWGRGLLRGRAPVRALGRAGNALAVIVVLPLLLGFMSFVDARGVNAEAVSYVEVPVYEEPDRQDGVWVDGMQVSNLFAYDAQGNPLDGVQLYDDRGRQVQTTSDGSWSDWSLPGIEEPWTFAAAQDVDGRTRWNVFPLSGAPSSEWDYDDEGERVLSSVASPRTPPRPFAKAPAVHAPEADGRTSGTQGEPTSDEVLASQD